MKRAEAVKKIAAILDQLQESGVTVTSLSIRRTELVSGFIQGQESFAKRVELVVSQTIEGECTVITEPAR